MSRGRYPRRIKSRRPAEEIVQKYLRRWNGADLYFTPERFPTLQSDTLFGNSNALALEVGCGTGEFLCSLAAHQPQVNFLGVEVALKPLYRAIIKANTRALENILFINADVKRLYPLFAPDSLLVVYLHFPVPNRKKKYQLFDEEYLSCFHSALVIGGRLNVRTDNRKLFSGMTALAAADPRFETVDGDRKGLLQEEGLRSHNQEIWEGRGKTTLGFELEKKEGVHGLPGR